MEITQLLKDYPVEAASAIAIVSGAIGWIINNLFQLLLESHKYKKELKTYFWKEKLNAAKKASEFYLENLNFLNLIRHQFEVYELGKLEHQQLFEHIENEVKFYSEKLKSFPHFEHHHINIFYNFNEDRAMEINQNTFEIQRKLYDLVPNENDSAVSMDEKIQEIKLFSKKLKDNYGELFELHKNYLRDVRNDIKQFL